MAAMLLSTGEDAEIQSKRKNMQLRKGRNSDSEGAAQEKPHRLIGER